MCTVFLIASLLSLLSYIGGCSNTHTISISMFAIAIMKVNNSAISSPLSLLFQASPKKNVPFFPLNLSALLAHASSLETAFTVQQHFITWSQSWCWSTCFFCVHTPWLLHSSDPALHLSNTRCTYQPVVQWICRLVGRLTGVNKSKFDMSRVYNIYI